MLIGLPQRHDFFQCIFQIIEKSHLYISYFDYFTSLTCYVQTVLVSCFRPIVILYVRSTFHYRTVLQAPKPATLRLFVVHSALLLSSNMENSTLTYYAFVTHFTFFIHIPRQGIVVPTYGYTTASNQFVKLPCKHFCISFCLSGYI